jgi:N6-L-threonylcarbamoyladenine synthase
MYVLGIETSCDETAISVVKNGNEVLSNVIFSQEKIHEAFGGVFPELASRSHLEAILPALEKALLDACLSLQEIDLIAVAAHPGLMGSLLMGVTAAKALAFALDKPFVAVNHVEAHLYVSLMKEPSFPALGLVVSGGHTSLYHITDETSYNLISQTVDDAIGEAFDKVARLLNLPYPGGPHVEALAKTGDPKRHPFKEAFVKQDPLAFSFSGLKTQVFYALQGKDLSEQDKADLAASFQETALQMVVKKSLKVAKNLDTKSLYIGGGVSANKRLRELFAQESPLDLKIFWPPKGLSIDNGAMIAGLGYHLYQKKGASDLFDVSPEPTSRIKHLSFSE